MAMASQRRRGLLIPIWRLKALDVERLAARFGGGVPRAVEVGERPASWGRVVGLLEEGLRGLGKVPPQKRRLRAGKLLLFRSFKLLGAALKQEASGGELVDGGAIANRLRRIKAVLRL